MRTASALRGLGSHRATASSWSAKRSQTTRPVCVLAQGGKGGKTGEDRAMASTTQEKKTMVAGAPAHHLSTAPPRQRSWTTDSADEELNCVFAHVQWDNDAHPERTMISIEVRSLRAWGLPFHPLSLAVSLTRSLSRGLGLLHAGPELPGDAALRHLASQRLGLRRGASPFLDRGRQRAHDSHPANVALWSISFSCRVA